MPKYGEEISMSETNEIGEVFLRIPDHVKEHWKLKTAKCKLCGGELNQALLCPPCGVDEYGREWPRPVFIMKQVFGIGEDK